MTEFLKGYAAGANDMEAGRLVTKPTVGVQTNSTAEQATIESLREQLGVARDQCDLAIGLRKAAEAKLAEVTKELAGVDEYNGELLAKLAEVEKERDELSRIESQLNTENVYLHSSIERARELVAAMKFRPAEVEQLARLLSGDENTTKGDT